MICLLPHCGYLSETSRMLELRRALRARGADVRVATHGGTYEHLLDPGYDLIGPPMSAERAAAFVRDGVGLGSPDQSMYSDDELRAYVRAEVDYFRRHDVTTVVTGFTLTTLLSSRVAGVRLVTEHAGSFVPPLFEHGLVPPPAERLARWQRAMPGSVVRRRYGRTVPGLPFYCAGFNRVAAELGVPGVPGLAALLLGDLTLVPEIPEVLGLPAAAVDGWVPGPMYRPETRLRCTGPLFARLEQPVPDEVQRFLDAPGPLVYVAITSSGVGLVRSVLEALAPLAVKVLVAATVHDRTALADVTGTAKFLVAGVLPSHRIMPRADLAVTAGGQGSVQTAMASGTPLLGIPLQPEQLLNVALVERLGAARSVPSGQATVSRLRRVARRMLGDPSYRRAAERIHDRYADVDGAALAAEAILDGEAIVPRAGASGAGASGAGASRAGGRESEKWGGDA
ncbi:nucleotide disphospho-sugar-binding domain-containing protein [Cryptosporangium arvum]|uniref:Glycosyl transferase, UDP-glucuronosyltransferase n=1 Tax=Cryptosporangium arvum DSM 44712 TaxID=927661 RepID=A0A010ZMJ4_9ACTN|nr:nucleotide disphospho-sugar-binding domain-containing protein [Cryptosporangium arvum]EXG79894.1 glycosyl transferase, UDP-glucuronosyltransferase [Cryptosporangium arvum DSM 44712]